MKILTFIFAFFVTQAVYAGTCTSISRTNSAANSVLTSTKYNTDLNTVYTHTNALDGGCVTDGTLEKVALDSSEFASPWDSFKDGCKVEYSSASQVTVGPCRMAVNSNWVNTSTTTTVAMGCGDCSSETANTAYYVYAKNGSDGTTLNLFLSTTAPTDNHGEDGSNNKVVGRLFNNTSSDIDQYSIDQWVTNDFVPQEVGWINGGTITLTAVTTAPSKGATDHDVIWWKRDGSDMLIRFEFEQTSAGSAGSGDYLVDLPTGYDIDTDVTSRDSGPTNDTRAATFGHFRLGNTTNGESGASMYHGSVGAYDNNSFHFLMSTAANSTQHWSSAVLSMGNTAIILHGYARVPVANWSY